jgi:hypothetical protein
MRRSLQSHITYLETLIQEVGERLTEPDLAPEEVEDLQLQLFSAQGALEHYRQAYALELSAAGSEPPPVAGDGKPNGGSKSQGKGIPERRKAAASHSISASGIGLRARSAPRLHPGVSELRAVEGLG